MYLNVSSTVEVMRQHARLRVSSPAPPYAMQLASEKQTDIARLLDYLATLVK